MEELKAWRPREVTIEVTYDCPLKCLHCSSYNSLSSPDDMLTTEEVDKVIDDLAGLEGELVEISGGEPLCHPDVYGMIQHAKEKGLEVHLYTCGVVKHGETIRPIDGGIARRLRQLGVDRILVNMQAASSQVHDSITGVRGSFDYLVDSVRCLVEHGLYVGAHFVPMNLILRSLRK